MADPAQRLHLTIIFSDLSNSTGIAASMEPELYADILQQLRDACEEIMAHHGGTIVRIDGDGVAIVFGHPVPYEDAGRRAIEAAIDLHAAMARDEFIAADDAPIQLHTGIHAGIALVRPGDLVRGRFEMLGDATNVAARLCDAAEPGEIVVSESTLGADIAFFKVSPRESLRLKGRAQPISVHRVAGRESVATRFHARPGKPATHFVGRRGELAQLEQWLAQAVGQQPLIASIVGPPGLGKTRLAGEFLARAEQDGVIVHRSYCEAYLGARPLQPIAQLARSIIARAKADAHADPARGVLQALAAAGSMRPDQPLPEPDAIAKALSRLLADTHRERPVIFYIDDWQWADDASRAIVELLAARQKQGVMFLFASRELDAGLTATVRFEAIELSPLIADEATIAIERLLPTPEPFLVQRVLVKAGGNPLFIEELCHALTIGDDPLAATDRTAWLDMLIQARWARLGDEQAHLVRTASVIGNVFPEWLFTAVTGIAMGSTELHDLAAEDFIFAGDVPGTLRFKHGLTRDAIYRTVALGERRAMHDRVVAALIEHAGHVDDSVSIETLAYHQAACGHHEEAAALSEKAGDRALAAAALDRAQAQYRAVIEALVAMPATPERARRIDHVVRRFGQACVVDPSREQLPVLEEASKRARRAEDLEGLGWSEYWLGFVLYGLGEPRLAIRRLRIAEDAAERTGNVKLRANVRATLGQAFAAACEYDAALVLLDEAIEIKRRHRPPGRPSIVLSYSLACRALIFADQGRFDQAHADFDAASEALAGVEHEMTASVETLRCAACLWQGRYDEARNLAEYSRGVAERARARYIFVNCNSLIGYPRWRLTHDPTAITAIVEATRWLENTGRQQFSSLNFGWLTEAMVELDRYEEARRYAARALLRARKGDALGAAMAMRGLTIAAARGQGRRGPAYYLERAQMFATRRGSAHEHAQNLSCAATVAAIGGDGGEACRLRDEADAAFAAMGMTSFAADIVVMAPTEIH